MATVYGDNYNAAYVAVPAQQVGVGEQAGRKRILFDKHTFAANVNAISDIVKIGKLPAGARVLEAVVACPSLGTTGILDFGWAASASGDIVADPNGFISGADAGGQAVLAKGAAAGVGAGIGKKFDEEVEIQLVFTEASDSAAGDTVMAWVEYILD
jgi:hypothetical protein